MVLPVLSERQFDYDSVQVPVLVDMEWQGQPRKVMLWANRNGFF